MSMQSHEPASSRAIRVIWVIRITFLTVGFWLVHEEICVDESSIAVTVSWSSSFNVWEVIKCSSASKVDNFEKKLKDAVVLFDRKESDEKNICLLF